VGFFALTTDFESHFDGWKNPVVSQTFDNDSSDDSGDFHSVNHITDLFNDTFDNYIITNDFQVRRIVLAPFHIKNSFICSIWQPPKFS
jgi:hypothetical protein